MGLLFAAVIDGNVQSTLAPVGSLAERILLLPPGAVSVAFVRPRWSEKPALGGLRRESKASGDPFGFRAGRWFLGCRIGEGPGNFQSMVR